MSIYDWWLIIDWMQLAQDRAQWWAVVYTLMNLGAPQKAMNFLTSCATIRFWMSLIYGVRILAANLLTSCRFEYRGCVRITLTWTSENKVVRIGISAILHLGVQGQAFRFKPVSNSVTYSLFRTGVKLNRRASAATSPAVACGRAVWHTGLYLDTH